MLQLISTIISWFLAVPKEFTLWVWREEGQFVTLHISFFSEWTDDLIIISKLYWNKIEDAPEDPEYGEVLWSTGYTIVKWIAIHDIFREWKNTGTQCSGADLKNPVHRHSDGTWWFFDETWSREYGPFLTREYASKDLVAYAKSLDSFTAKIEEISSSATRIVIRFENGGLKIYNSYDKLAFDVACRLKVGDIVTFDGRGNFISLR